MTPPPPRSPSNGQAVTLACLWEVTAPKPGNVHRGADFDDLRFTDLVNSAVAIGPSFDRAEHQRVGATVLQAIQATRAFVSTNTNLGIVLLLAPLAASPSPGDRGSVQRVLDDLTADDSRDVYAAIRMARPGGLDDCERYDVNGPPPADLLDAMTLAAPRDRIARQYTAGFEDVLEVVAPRLAELIAGGLDLMKAIVRCHVEALARWGDSLIARKRGPHESELAAAIAAQVIAVGPPESDEYEHRLADLDFWLRSHRGRNPGTTADLMAAALFVGLRSGTVGPPF